MKFSEALNQAYSEARTRLTVLTDQLTESDLKKILAPSPNSLGFLIRHIADVEFLFSKNVFKATEITVRAKTVIYQKDTGEWIDQKELLEYLKNSFSAISQIINLQPENSWNDLITTTEFGTKTKIEAFGRIISHTAYHTGQIAMIMKYGKTKN